MKFNQEVTPHSTSFSTLSFLSYSRRKNLYNEGLYRNQNRYIRPLRYPSPFVTKSGIETNFDENIFTESKEINHADVVIVGGGAAGFKSYKKHLY